jgi:hypothetical protein
MGRKFNVISEPRLGRGILHYHRVSSLAEVNPSVLQEKNLLTDLTENRVQDPGINNSPSETGTARHHVVVALSVCNMFTISSNNTNLTTCGIGS